MFEREDADPILISLGAFLILVLLLFSGVVLGYYVSRVRARPQAGSVAAPKLQRDPSRDLQSYLETERVLLNSYGWVDRDRGVARIPIPRAMEILSHESR